MYYCEASLLCYLERKIVTVMSGTPSTTLSKYVRSNYVLSAIVITAINVITNRIVKIAILHCWYNI